MALLLVAVAATHADAQESTASLTADAMNYDPTTGEIEAAGNVHFQRPDGELFGDRGRGKENGRNFEMHGNVRGSFEAESLDIVCESIGLSSEGEPPVRKIAASGDVVLTHSGDRLSAQAVRWEMDRENYRAQGNVLGSFAQYSIDADEIARNGEQFWAQNIRNYEDRNRRITLRAQKASGLVKNGEVTELITEGRVSTTMPDNQGIMARITGDKGVFSLARGTIVISGNAIVTQGDRRLNAGSIVYHLDTGRIDALGSPRLIFDLPQE